jgi:hypothetical protein
MAELKPGTSRMTHPDPDVDDAIVLAMQVPHFERAGFRHVEGDREDWPEELRQEGGREGQVYLHHPETGAREFVPEQAAAHWRSRGWVVVDPQAEQVAELEAETVPKLRELAKNRGISPIPSTKAELIEALEDQEKQAEDDDQAGDEPAKSEEEE